MKIIAKTPIRLSAKKTAKVDDIIDLDEDEALELVSIGAAEAVREIKQPKEPKEK
jgi:hypothetical protein